MPGEFWEQACRKTLDPGVDWSAPEKIVGPRSRLMGDEKKTILIADDDLEVLALVAHQLKAALDVEVLEASDGEEALEVAREHRPDLVVLDVMMPAMSGWEVCRAIRDDADIAETGIIMLTGIGERLNEMTSPLYGADAYVDKPFEPSELAEVVRQLLGGRTSESS